jgi:hypothetical protein
MYVGGLLYKEWIGEGECVLNNLRQVPEGDLKRAGYFLWALRSLPKGELVEGNAVLKVVESLEKKKKKFKPQVRTIFSAEGNMKELLRLIEQSQLKMFPTETIASKMGRIVIGSFFSALAVLGGRISKIDHNLVYGFINNDIVTVEAVLGIWTSPLVSMTILEREEAKNCVLYFDEVFGQYQQAVEFYFPGDDRLKVNVTREILQLVKRKFLAADN